LDKQDYNLKTKYVQTQAPHEIDASLFFLLYFLYKQRTKEKEKEKKKKNKGA